MAEDLLQLKVSEVVEYLDPLLPLANCHTVDFITNHLWDTLVPERIRDFVKSTDIETVFGLFQEFYLSPSKCECRIFSEFEQFIARARNMSLTNFNDITYTVEKLQEKLMSLGSSNHESAPVYELMSTKKTHEVEVMSEVVVALAQVCGVSHVVDVGSGKGYLSSTLALHHRLLVLGMDSSRTNTHGAAHRTKKLQSIGTNKSKSVDGHCMSYKQVTEYVTEDTNLINLINEKFPESQKCEKILLVGLHTCGNLASTSLRLFVNDAKITGLCNVGCCYHLMKEEFSKNPFEEHSQCEIDDDFGFPMSSFLQSKTFLLGRNARMLAAQSLERIHANPEQCLQSVKSLHYRALLQVLLVEKLGTAQPQHNVGRLASKCSSFAEYIHKALKKIGVSHLKVTEMEIEELYKKHQTDLHDLQVFHLLRLALAPVIEGLILLDRLLYLKEQGTAEQFLVKMFDSCVSPRCFGIVALK